jgi:hypothetical protein
MAPGSVDFIVLHGCQWAIAEIRAKPWLSRCGSASRQSARASNGTRRGSLADELVSGAAAQGMASQTQEFRMTTQLEPRPVSGRSNISKDTGTAETDENYDLVSVLYHCLKAADACTQYVADAEDAGDDELVEFFDRARQLQNRLASQARELLAQRLADAAEASDEES